MWLPAEIPVGEIWPLEAVLKVRDEVWAAGLEMEVIESVNVHEDIKKGLPSRVSFVNNIEVFFKRTLA